MALSLAACSGGGDASGSGSGSGSGSNSGETKKVGLSMPTQSLERWNRDGSYLDEQFKSAGYETIITYSDNDTNRQVSDIQNMIAEGVDLLVVAAIDGEALNTVMNEAGEAGIPVIAYDRLIMNDNVSYYVSFDNYTVGTLQGQYIVDALDLENAAGPFNIELTAGDPADNNAGYFFQGAMDVLQPYMDSGKLNVVSGQTDFDAVATDKWDTSTALGVAQAIESDYTGSNQPIITGQDGDEANLKNIVDGKQSMTVYKAVANEAVVTLALAQAILNGEQPGEELTSQFDCECAYDTSSYDNNTGIIPSYLLTPTVVTADNIQEELVDTGYYTMGSDGYPVAVG